MNALPVAPEQIEERSYRSRYFLDMKRWGFDIAYTGVYGHTRQQVFAQYRDRYLSFAEEAHHAGFPACVQVQVTVAPSAEIPLSEAQYHREGRPHVLSDGSFFASFASETWTRYLEEITAVFFQEYGYDWVVFEEPMLAVDVPGPGDRFTQSFLRQYPDVELPTTSTDTASYRLVQESKAAGLTGFLRRLMSSAKQAGASMTGVMPWFFIPTIENTPQQTLNTSCDIGAIIGLEELDLVVVRMQPDNIYADVMRTGDDLQQSPLLYYPEVIAHQAGKPLIAVNNPCNEHTDDPGCPLLPLDFFKRATLASFAGAPSGMTRHWYGYQYDAEDEHMAFFSALLPFTNRLGGMEAAIGYVFSHYGARHGLPYPYEQIWRRWWGFGREMLLEKLAPARTLWASDLARELEQTPELRLLVLSSCFPLDEEQMQCVQTWLSADAGRGLVVFAESPQLSADPASPGHVPLESSFPGLHKMLGLPWPEALADESGKLLLAMSPSSAASFSRHTGLSPDLAPLARFRDQQALGEPQETSNTIAVFPLGPVDSPEGVCRFVRGIAAHCGAPASIVASASISVLWNQTSCGYVVLTNPGHAAAEVSLRPEGQTVWDVASRHVCLTKTMRIPPFGFRILRLVSPDDPVLDVDGQMSLLESECSVDRCRLRIISGRRLILRCRRPVQQVAVDGRNIAAACISRKQHYECRLQTIPGERCIVDVAF